MSIKGKVAIVTGASSGIGQAISHKLGSEGAVLAICARRETQLKETAEAVRKEGAEAFAIACDISDRRQVAGFVGEVVDRFGRVDFLINNAGISGSTPLAKPDDEVWDQVIRTNLHGTYFMTSQVVPGMPDGGRIVNIASILAKFGVPGYAAYCTAKTGILGFTRVAALELAPRKITVNALCPGWVETAMARDGMERGAKATGTSYEQFREEAIGRVPLKAIIEPAEVAELVTFLLSPAARNITGQAYNICGGQAMH